MVQSIICCKVHETGLFSILVDETKDISKKEQITFVLRCIDPKEGTVHEYFLTFVEAITLDTKSLTESTVDTLRKHELDITYIVYRRDMIVLLSWVDIAQTFKHDWRSLHHTQFTSTVMLTF